jgi:hypothetical protein
VFTPKIGDNIKSMSIKTLGADAHFSNYRFVKDLHHHHASSNGGNANLRCELDSHADTWVAGNNSLEIDHIDGRTVTVAPYTKEYEPKPGVRISTVAYLWEEPESGKPYVLIVHEALYFGDELEGSLMNPNQIRDNGIRVDDVPRQFDRTSTHSIHIPEHEITIPLSLNGVVSGFECRKPTWEEYEMNPKIELTSNKQWNPLSADFAERERRVAAVAIKASHEELLIQRNTERQIAAARAVYTATMTQTPYEDDMAALMIAHVNVASDDPDGDGLAGRLDEVVYPPSKEQRRIMSLSTIEKRSTLTPAILSQRWGIGLEAARNTLSATTQAGVRNVLAPGERKVRQRLDHLKFPNLRGRYYTDTMFSKVKSTRGHKAAQIFTNGHGYDRFYPLASKSLAGEALMSFIHDAGIPQILISDNSGEQTFKDFGDTCKKYRIKRKFTIPHSPWANLAEASIRELKVGMRRAMR